MKTVVLASGGLDSSVLLYLLKREHAELLPIHVNYGQLAEPQEWASAQAILYEGEAAHPNKGTHEGPRDGSERPHSKEQAVGARSVLPCPESPLGEHSCCLRVRPWIPNGRHWVSSECALSGPDKGIRTGRTDRDFGEYGDQVPGHRTAANAFEGRGRNARNEPRGANTTDILVPKRGGLAVWTMFELYRSSKRTH